jgi:hypothetical protein
LSDEWDWRGGLRIEGSRTTCKSISLLKFLECFAKMFARRQGDVVLQFTGVMEVHDLYSEKANCQIEEILRARNAVGFQPDTLAQARSEAYDNCAYCIGGSMR